MRTFARPRLTDADLPFIIETYADLICHISVAKTGSRRFLHNNLSDATEELTRYIRQWNNVEGIVDLLMAALDTAQAKYEALK